MRIICEAHAKINWSLNILGVREDGYHELDMLMQGIELCDELSFERARWLTLTVDGQPLPVGERNLVVRAANALNDYMGQRNGARIRLTKRIPARAGLGGGSADCAAALLALNRLWNLRLPMPALMEIGAKLGADVPFCILGGLARVGGFGERLTPLPDAPSIPLAMVTPGDGLSTAAVFRAWDGEHRPDGAKASPMAPKISEGGGAALPFSASRGGSYLDEETALDGVQSRRAEAPREENAGKEGRLSCERLAGREPCGDMLALADALRRRDFGRAQALSVNSLEAAAIRLLPAVGEAMEAFRAAGAPFVRMSGSGSTVFAAFETEAEAERAVERVPGAILTRTVAVRAE